jgi:hypothetical protein
VAGVGEEGEGSGGQPAGDLGDEDDASEPEAGEQPSPVRATRVGVTVVVMSVSGSVAMAVVLTGRVVMLNGLDRREGLAAITLSMPTRR